MMKHWQSFLLGLVGFALGFLLWTAYDDHVKLNFLWVSLTQETQQSREKPAVAEGGK